MIIWIQMWDQVGELGCTVSQNTLQDGFFWMPTLVLWNKLMLCLDDRQEIDILLIPMCIVYQKSAINRQFNFL